MGVAEPVQIRYQQYSLDERRNACVKVCPEISMPIGSSGLFGAKEEFSLNLICIAEPSERCGYGAVGYGRKRGKDECFFGKRKGKRSVCGTGGRNLPGTVCSGISG